MELDNNFTALLIAIVVISLLVGLAIYYNTPYFKAVQSSQNTSKKPPAKISLSSQLERNLHGRIYNTQFTIDKSQFKKAPEFAGVTAYVNTAPIKLADLRGKVVLVHFWTYTCINCIHTIPHLNEWYNKYGNKSFEIVTVHTPEFEFEKSIDNVKKAVKDLGIKYPVIQDNNNANWNVFGNRYWPRDYLIDDEGYIRYDHIGEGDYAQQKI
jgi:thiol-disulfide isomerase/thioredoxin